jgi:hypothetical protein
MKNAEANSNGGWEKERRTALPPPQLFFKELSQRSQLGIKGGGRAAAPGPLFQGLIATVSIF